MSRQEQIHPLKAARENCGLSKRALAEKLSLGKTGHNRIWEWESGGYVPKIIYANELARVLGFESGEKLRQLCQQWIAEHPDKVKLAKKPKKQNGFNGTSKTGPKTP